MLIHFDTDNDAFEQDRAGAIARVLRTCANRVEGGATEFAVYDDNGNRIGDCVDSDAKARPYLDDLSVHLDDKITDEIDPLGQESTKGASS